MKSVTFIGGALVMATGIGASLINCDQGEFAHLKPSVKGICVSAAQDGGPIPFRAAGGLSTTTTTKSATTTSGGVTTTYPSPGTALPQLHRYSTQEDPVIPTHFPGVDLSGPHRHETQEDPTTEEDYPAEEDPIAEEVTIEYPTEDPTEEYPEPDEYVHGPEESEPQPESPPWDPTTVSAEPITTTELAVHLMTDVVTATATEAIATEVTAVITATATEAIATEVTAVITEVAVIPERTTSTTMITSPAPSHKTITTICISTSGTVMTPVTGLLAGKAGELTIPCVLDLTAAAAPTATPQAGAYAAMYAGGGILLNAFIGAVS